MSKRGPIAPGHCPAKSSGIKFRSLDQVVKHYKSEYMPRVKQEVEEFASMRRFEVAITRAGLAEDANGKRYDHQRRIPGHLLKAAADTLLKAKAQLKGCRTFDNLRDVVENNIRTHGIGELTVYDAALRIGAHLGILPVFVYLHAGTRDGAKALGLAFHQDKLALASLPRPLRCLDPYQVEDCLCIYKDEF